MHQLNKLYKSTIVKGSWKEVHMIKGSFRYVRSEGEGVNLKEYESILGGGVFKPYRT